MNADIGSSGFRLIVIFAAALVFGMGAGVIAQDTAGEWYNQALKKQGAKDLDGAIADYTKAIEIDPEMAAAFYNRGLAKYGKEDYEGAIEDYTKAIKLDPEHSAAFRNRGLAKKKIGDTEGAAGDAKRAAELKRAEEAGGQ